MKRFLSFVLLATVITSSFAQTNISLRALVQFNDEANDIWGYVDSTGNEYALVGLRGGTEIVDVTDPDNPIKLHSIPGPQSTWRDLKTWSHYAYVTNETSNGLLIIDLAYLPDSIAFKEVNFNAELATAHNIFIDERGFAYMFGFNDSVRSIPTDQRGAYIIDLRTDPWNPTFAGRYATAYVHDGYVRGDTMWTSQVYAGNFAVVDVSVKGSLTVLANQETPSRFTHNSWLTDDGKYLVNSDEVLGGYISFYDVSDLDNIFEADRYQASPGSGVIPHNAFVLGDFVITSYYKEGVVILDATKKNNVIEIGQYDTSPL
jgi:choice-of-anchor B domain-containing protein